MAVLHARSPAVVSPWTAVGLVLLSVACVKDSSSDSGEALPDSLGRCAPDNPVVWLDVEPVFSEHCTECHSSELEDALRQGAPVGIDYDTAESSRLNSDRSWQMIVTEQMPLQNPVPTEEALLVWSWLSCGGPE